MKNISVDLDNLTIDESIQLCALVEKANKFQSKVWTPKYGESYFIISSDGYIYCKDACIDSGCFSIGNCYRTAAEANFALEKRKVEVELQRYADEHNEESTSAKWSICYYTDDGTISASGLYICCTNAIYFSSFEIALDAIKAIGEERIKKFYLGIDK